MSQFVGRWRAETTSDEVPGYTEFMPVLDVPEHVQEMIKGRIVTLELALEGDTWTSKSSLEGMPGRINKFKLGQDVESERMDGTIQNFRNITDGDTWIEEITPVSNPNGNSIVTKRTVNGDVMDVNVTIVGQGASISFKMLRQ
ncbi:fatty acid-binding protein-like [Pecten maximus]|uniref:fatty acid-binding protein-like n=1 Tax=Pecten maximus TaxID=6579 RepID=UPI001458E6CA|nr:fatty acid-binding protein-like [Pecten maximus]